MKKSMIKLLTLATILTSSSVFAAWPDKPITIIVPWGAGGNTDTVARLVAQGLQKELGVNVNVVNRTGGSGVVGHDALKRAAPDGYTLGVVTAEIALMHHQKMTDLTYADYTPISRLAVIYGGLQVAKDSPYKNATQLIDFIKKHPGKLKASGSGLNSIWHLNLLGMLKSAGLPASSVKYIPSQGSSAALQELVSGGIDFITSSPGEAKSMVDAGMVRHLAIMSPEPSKLYANVPVFKKATGYNWTLTAWNVLAAPKALPSDIENKLIAAMKKVYQSGELQSFANKQGFEVSALYGNDVTQFMAQEDQKFGELLKAE
ncbi:tripartite tricarboxylate transporter substrate binding protein [Prodigiosinella confusarubida]|uniref:Tripartite tricarboxylate transporter substrate binding protein n=2 Tax=Serratia sp. (strain ATCC 39006) TaxID=104623 RepID=A0A2I5T1Z9_SERS3|nr:MULTISPECIES: tripartite tricarboxylate transporter substrate binding protein [Pectobacteriaceae]AUG98606.1 tripartite tricarboxylate transporter substrate binding protein [Serratia sp. ATCC 39006]AUH02921.1 tripartite tricarboxylate transporter substrate binding protein [Serratia sp. ATCC 39006]WJV54072.1 tripartite tricarboxylate transporter substrate binding protein [Prodigiosinella sp. LS101]WJV58434.1 tripartite tricarboxylate transporter substrate binding protein [Pectobacteriaceae bac